MLYNQFVHTRLFRNRLTGTTSERIKDVLLKVVTLDPHYMLPQREQGLGKTMFEEIEMVPAEETLTPDQLALMEREARTSTLGRHAFLDVCIERLVEFVEQNLSPTKFHLLYSSSGFDSRIIGWTLKLLKEKLGEIWLGDLLFVCVGREGPTFKEIMELEGWDRTQWVWLADESAHFAACLNFERAGRWVNGISPSFFNYNYILGDRLQEMGLIPENDDKIQVITGFGSDFHLIGAGASLGNGLRFRWKRCYEGSISMSPFKFDDVLYPMISYGLIEAVIDSQQRLAYEIRPQIVRRMSRALKVIDRCDPVPGTLPVWLFDQVIKDYEQSWYGRKVHPLAITLATAENRFDPWWMHWSRAAFCEGLLKEGYTINVG